MDSKGTVRVVADERRSQLRNREAAIKRLNDLVREALKKPKPRKKTRPPASANIKRLEEKRKRGELKRQRRPINRDE
jgi:ribosome-associated protein